MPNFIEQQAISKSSDEAPEAVSMSASKIQALNIKKKEREVQQKLLGIKKRKRREIDAKIKEQKSRNSKKKIDNIMKKINEDGLPKFLPTELLEDFANDDKMKKRKHQPSEEHTQVRLKMSKIEPTIKKKIKEHINTGPFTVVALQDLDIDKLTPISKGIMEFKDDHFYGERLLRKNVILNVSQGRKGAAIRFCRK